MPSEAIKINRPHGERTESNLINSLANSDSSATVTTVSLLPFESFDSNNSLLLPPPLPLPILPKKVFDKSKTVSHVDDDLNEGEGSIMLKDVDDCEENDQDDEDEEENEEDFDISIRFDDYQSMDTAEESTEPIMQKCNKSHQSVGVKRGSSPSPQQSQTFKQQNSQTSRRFNPTVHLRGSSINTIFQRQSLSGSSSSSSSNQNNNNTISTSSSNSSSNDQRGNLSSRSQHASGDFF